MLPLRTNCGHCKASCGRLVALTLFSMVHQASVSRFVFCLAVIFTVAEVCLASLNGIDEILKEAEHGTDKRTRDVMDLMQRDVDNSITEDIESPLDILADNLRDLRDIVTAVQERLMGISDTQKDLMVHIWRLEKHLNLDNLHNFTPPTNTPYTHALLTNTPHTHPPHTHAQRSTTGTANGDLQLTTEHLWTDAPSTSSQQATTLSFENIKTEQLTTVTEELLTDANVRSYNKKASTMRGKKRGKFDAKKARAQLIGKLRNRLNGIRPKRQEVERGTANMAKRTRDVMNLMKREHSNVIDNQLAGEDPTIEDLARDLEDLQSIVSAVQGRLMDISHTQKDLMVHIWRLEQAINVHTDAPSTEGPAETLDKGVQTLTTAKSIVIIDNGGAAVTSTQNEPDDQSAEEQSAEEQSAEKQSASAEEQSGEEHSVEHQPGEEQSGEEQSGVEQSGVEQSGDEKSAEEQSTTEKSSQSGAVPTVAEKALSDSNVRSYDTKASIRSGKKRKPLDEMKRKKSRAYLFGQLHDKLNGNDRRAAYFKPVRRPVGIV